MKFSRGSSLIDIKYIRKISPVFSGVRVTRTLVLCVCFVDRCLSFCTFFFWLLCCMFFFDLQILITPLISANSTYDYGCFKSNGL